MRTRQISTVRRLCGAVAFCLPFVVGCSGSLGAVAGGSGVSTSSAGVATGTERPEMPLVPSHRNLDFGIVPQGDRVRQFFELRNMSDRTIELDRVETSCECLEVNLARRIIAPGETMIAVALLDLTRAADFTGRLGVDVKCLANDEATESWMTIDVDVRPTPKFAGLRLEFSAENADGSSVVPEPMPMQR